MVMATPHFRFLAAPPLALLLLLISCCLLPAALSSSRGGGGRDLLMLDRFHRWMARHGRSYPNADEKLRRFEVYRRNVEYIEATNRDGGLSYELGENEFTDLTHDEFVARYTGGLLADEDDAAAAAAITTLAGDVSEGHAADKPQVAALPSSVDWREQGAVTPAKNQGRCGSCWAFASVATVESQHQIKTGELVDLSEQEVLDCDRYGQFGCRGGYPKRALEWIKDKGGIMTEDAYPYTGDRGQCKANDTARRVGEFIVAVRQVPPYKEAALAEAVADQPVAVAIDAKDANLQHYKSGIYTGPCTTAVNHAVVLVGYASNLLGTEYWIVKNSWGETWGQKGFFFLRKGANGRNGQCGVAMRGGVYPVIAGPVSSPAN